MPIYEYHCENCGTKFDALRTMSAADEKIACNKCQSEKTHRILSTCFTHGSGQTSSNSSCGGCSSNSCAGCAH